MRDGKGKFMAKTEQAVSVRDRIAKLREEANQLEQQRATEIRSEIDELVAELNDLTGADYRLVEKSAAPPPAPVKKPKAAAGPGKTAKGPSAKYDESKFCQKCQKTGHNQKAHNLAEGFKDIAFSDEELKRRGYWPPAEAAKA